MKKRLAACAVMLMQGCVGSGTADDSTVGLGIIEYVRNLAVIDAPTSALVNTEVTITMRTYAGGCVSIDRTDVESDAEGFIVKPYDRLHMRELCSDELQFFSHIATLSFDSPGSKTVRVAGRHVDADIDVDIEIPVSIAIE